MPCFRHNPAANGIARLREHLTVVRSVLSDGTVDFHGELWTAVHPGVPIRPTGVEPCPLLVAALGPRALQATGELADGTLLYLTGPHTIRTYIAPTIRGIAAASGRPVPRIIAMISVSVTDDLGAARAHAHSSMAFYDDLPAFQAVMNREGVRASELAVIGDEDSVRQQLRAYTDAGATEFILMPLDADATRLHKLWTLAATL